MIIPFFIPHSGCSHLCIFCNQNRIIGQAKPIDPASVPDKIITYLIAGRKEESVSVAFYGGSFTALPFDVQDTYLTAVQPFIKTGAVHGITLSTRPDCITRPIVASLQQRHVRTIELGVQSMNDDVLLLAGRGHTARDTINSVGILKEIGITVGIQMMFGLPGDTPETFMQTIESVIALKPDFVRLYPLLVLKDTLLEKLYREGKYVPITLEKAVHFSKKALVRFEEAGIVVSRLGLQSTEELEKPGAIVAGPYHPAFKQLVESSIFLDRMRAALQGKTDGAQMAVFCVHPRDVSAAIGQRRSNIELLKKEFGLHAVKVVRENSRNERRNIMLLKIHKHHDVRLNKPRKPQ